MAKKRGLSMKINKTMFIITTSLALWIIASAGHADGSLKSEAALLSSRYNGNYCAAAVGSFWA
jgi:hypothetical protein